MEIHVLHRQGKSVRGIGKQLGLSRNTVRRYLRDLAVIPRYPDRAARPTKLDPYKSYLVSRIEAAKPHWIPATVLLGEIRAHGYEGRISQLRPISPSLNPSSTILLCASRHHRASRCRWTSPPFHVIEPRSKPSSLRWATAGPLMYASRNMSVRMTGRAGPR